MEGCGVNILICEDEEDLASMLALDTTVMQIHKPVPMEKLLEIAVVMTNTFPKAME
jgi:hypothetical protein